LNRIVHLCFAPALWIACSASVHAGSFECDNLRGGTINIAVDWEKEIKPILRTDLGGRCTGCHMGSRFPDLTDTGVDAIYKLVNFYALPGRPLDSGLFDKVNCATPALGDRMPLDGMPLTLDQQALIYDWIEQGALGEDPGMPIQRSFAFRDGMESLRWY
jgi:hypothetical protein